MQRSILLLALTLLSLMPATAAAGDDTPSKAKASRQPTIHGRVVSAVDGAAIEGARVLVLGTNFGNRGHSETTSSKSGMYALPEAPIGGAFLIVYGPDWISEGLAETAFDAPTPLIHRLEPKQAYEFELRVVPAPRLRGRVVDHKQRAVAGAVITLTLQALPGWLHLEENLHRTTTEADGSYTFAPLLPGKWYQALIQAEGEAPWWTDFTCGAAHRELNATLPRPRWRRVRIVDEDERPVAGAEIVLVLQDDDAFPTELDTYTSAADGSVRLGPLPPGPIAARVTREGFLDSPLKEGYQTLPAREPDKQGSLGEPLVLSRGLQVSGRVVDAHGEAVAGLPVSARWQGTWWGQQPGNAATTDELGRFTIRTLAPGTYAVNVFDVLTHATIATAADVEAGSRDLRLALPHGWRPATPQKPDESVAAPQVTVRVTDGGGQVLFDARVGFYAPGIESYGGLAEGVHTLALIGLKPDDTFWLEVSRASTEGGSPRPLASVLRGPFRADLGRIEVQLEPERTIAGRVLDADGHGVPHVRVAAQLRHPYRHDALTEPHSETTTDDRGQFLLRQLGQATYSLVVLENEALAAPKTPLRVEAGTQNVEIHLPRTVRPVLHVVDWKPVAPAWPLALLIDAQDPKNIVARAGIEADGTARFPPVIAEHYVLWILPQGSASYYRPKFDPQPGPLRITLERGAAIRGRLHLPDGATATEVFAVHARGMPAFGTVGDDGTYEILGLPDGMWTVVARASTPAGSYGVEVQVEAGGKRDLKLVKADSIR